jgi:tripartite-type tricarboxylate transporter receptor subunit TctC
MGHHMQAPVPVAESDCPQRTRTVVHGCEDLGCAIDWDVTQPNRKMSMKIFLKNAFRSFVAAIALCLPGTLAAQGDYPSRPVRMIVPYPAGGGTDLVSRQIAQKLGERLKQNVVVENRGGAGGLIGSEAASRATPDGYTIAMIAASYTVMPSLHKLSYDPVRDISPISMVGTSPSLVAVHPAVPIGSIKELIAYAKANPGKLNYGSSGQGGNTHLTTELFMLMAGVRMTHVPYKGNGPAVVALAAGEVQVAFSSMLSLLPQAKAGRVRAIAITGARRSPAVPDIPTVAESGVPGYEAASWYGVAGPAKFPQSLISRFNKELGVIATDPQVKDRMALEGLESLHTTPAEFGRVIAQDIAKWAKVVKAAKIVAQ